MTPDENPFHVFIEFDEPRPGEIPSRKLRAAGLALSEAELMRALDALDPGGEGTMVERTARLVESALRRVSIAAGKYGTEP